MPSHVGLRPLKSWRYVGVYGDELMLCVASVRIGPVRQSFWAVWDRLGRALAERTVLGRGAVRLAPGRVKVSDPSVEIDLVLEESPGIEAVNPSGSSYAWTRKQGGIRACGTVSLQGRRRSLAARAVVDDTAGYYERHTHWRWSAGVGTSDDGRELAWNLVDGVNDPAVGSERAVWIAGVAHEPPPSRFAPDLSAVDELVFHAEAVRERHENRLLLRSAYRQPFGTFTGQLPGGLAVSEGYGVMEEHDVYW